MISTPLSNVTLVDDWLIESIRGIRKNVEATKTIPNAKTNIVKGFNLRKNIELI